jgi:hypothetical protein
VGGACGIPGRGEECIQGSDGKAKMKELGRPRHRWEDGIRVDLGEIGLWGVDWIRLAEDRDRSRAVVSAVLNLWVLAPWSQLVSCVTYDFSMASCNSSLIEKS